MSIKCAKLFLIVISAFVSSCGNKASLSAQELNNYVADEHNGLLKKYETVGAIIKVFYWPKEFILYNEQKNSSVSGNSNLKIDSIDYFIVKISSKRQMDRNSQFLNDVQYHTKLLVHSDTIQVEDVQLNTIQNSSDINYTFLFAFKSYLDKVDEEVISIILSEKTGSESLIQFRMADIHRVQKFVIKD